MKINNKILEIETNTNGELKSIKYKGLETLHVDNKFWAKTYPMIWPVISNSKGFQIEGNDYDLPRHGFWKELPWQEMKEAESITLVATNLADGRYPFTIDIQQNISLNKNKVIIKTIFSNLSKDTAYFHFGHHPAFKIQSNSFIKLQDNPMQLIANGGKLLKDELFLEKISNVPFEDKFDTLVKKNWAGDVSLFTNEYQIKLTSHDFNSLQIWQPKNANFICLEPWQGYNDDEYDAPKQASKKLDIVEMQHGEVKTFEITIEYIDIKK